MSIPTKAEAIAQVLDLATQAFDTFRPAIGKRHYVAGVGKKGEPDIYTRILEVESALLNLTKACVEAQIKGP